MICLSPGWSWCPCSQGPHHPNVFAHLPHWSSPDPPQTLWLPHCPLAASLSPSPAGVPPAAVSLSLQPPGGQGSGPLLGTGPSLELHHVGDNDSGQYRCRVSDGDSVAQSDPLNVTVLGEWDPQAGGDPTMVGSAPVTFTWLHNGQEVAQGPLRAFGDIDVGHSGTYHCMATNQLGQDGHRVFQALSPELALEVTPGSPWVTGRITCALPRVDGDPWVSKVTCPVFLCRCHEAPGKVSAASSHETPFTQTPSTSHPLPHNPYSHRAPPDPLALPVEDPQPTYMELQRQPWEPSDIYDNLHQKL
uniref:Ig-like domain-containing protein n=1 Tax=Zonotrichia albicollis TaxID=44394 RepID=A0A8D2MQX9_ZONAL